MSSTQNPDLVINPITPATTTTERREENDISLKENTHQFAKKQSVTQTAKNSHNMTKRNVMETEHSLKLRELKMSSTQLNVEEFEQYVKTYKPNTSQSKNIDKLAVALNIIHTQNTDHENFWLLTKQYVENKTEMLRTQQSEFNLLKEQDDFNQTELEQYIAEIEELETKIKDLEAKVVNWKEYCAQKLRETDTVFMYYMISLFLSIIYSYSFGVYGFYEVVGVHFRVIQNVFIVLWVSFTGTLHVIVNATTMINDTAAYMLG